MLLNLNELEELATRKKFVPTPLDNIYYAFWDKGITLKELEELPIPYIIRTMNTLTYFKEKEAEAYKKK